MNILLLKAIISYQEERGVFAYVYKDISTQKWSLNNAHEHYSGSRSALIVYYSVR